ELLADIHDLFSRRNCWLVRRITCGYPWPELEGKRFGMIQERFRSSDWCLRDRISTPTQVLVEGSDGRQCVVMIPFLFAPRVSALAGCDMTEGMRQTLGDPLSMIYTGDEGQELFTSARRRMTWRQFILALGLHTEEEMAKVGFGAYWQGSERAPEKVTSVDLFYLHSMDRGTANVLYLLAQYLFRHAEGRKSGDRLSGGHFIGRLVAYFRLVSDQGLRGLSRVTSELPLIDSYELGRLNIHLRVGETWSWVAPGPERQPNVAAGAPGAAKDAPAADEGAQADPEPMQAPQPPPPALRTIQQRVSRLEDEVQEL
ncbi:hypothetical protein Tco_0496059, partial [Tanacetum coccineum]